MPIAAEKLGEQQLNKFEKIFNWENRHCAGGGCSNLFSQFESAQKQKVILPEKTSDGPKMEGSEDEIYKVPEATVWPEPLDEAAYYGLAGEWVRMVLPHTEADPAALLFQFLVAFGNIVGRGPYFMVEVTEHHCNEFLLLAGTTSKGRKGTAWDHVRKIAGQIDSDWNSECVKSGLTSGEGLIYHVRDGAVNDKRLVAYESEFATILKIIERKVLSIL